MSFDARISLGLGLALALLPAVPTAGIPADAEREVCSNGEAVVALLVDPLLADSIRHSLDQFAFDLCIEGYAVIETSTVFGTPTELRSYLVQLHADTQGTLAGAILVGDHPRAYQWVTIDFTNPTIPTLSEEVISYQVYADLNGIFEASPGYRSPGGHDHSYDIHRGDIDWEIWIGVLPLYRGDYAATADALVRYFRKNHAFRVGRGGLPRNFLQVTELLTATTVAEHEELLAGLRSGIYAWTPFSNAAGARLYFDSSTTGLTVANGYEDLSAGVADFTVLDAHGYWGAHGQLDIDHVESEPVKTSFLWSNGCAVGDLDRTENWLTSVLYSPTSSVILAKGTTNNSGGMGNNRNGFFGHNVASEMERGGCFGDAILSHVNVPLITPWAESREFHFATSVIIGDPTLSLNNRRRAAAMHLQEEMFRVSALWRTPQGSAGAATPVRLTTDTGYLWYFRSANIEVIAKVLDGCAVNDRYWFFAGGLTNVETTLQVEHLLTGETRTYTNPQGTPFLPIQNTDAFATCD